MNQTVDFGEMTLMRIAIASLLMALSVSGCSTSRSAAICGRVTNGTYMNEPLDFGLRLAEGWSIVPNTEAERAVTTTQGSRPVERALVTAVKKDDAGSAVIVCLLTPARPEQVFANTALKFAQESQTGTVDRANINGLELIHRQYRYGYRGNAWLSDLYVCERSCGTLAVLVTQNDDRLVGPAGKLLREMLIDGHPTGRHRALAAQASKR